MKAPNKFLLITISFVLALGVFFFAQHNTNKVINKSIKAIEKATCECEC
jgi:hypothetical protein